MSRRTVPGILVVLLGAITAPVLAFAAAPGNDDFAGAQSLAPDFSDVISTNVDATDQAGAGEPDHASSGFGPAHSVWYQWSPAADGSHTIDTCGSNFDTRLAVYVGAGLGSLSEVAANDNAGAGTNCPGPHSQISSFFSSGATYYIAVDTSGQLPGPGCAPTGTFALRLDAADSGTPIACGGSSAPQNDDFSAAGLAAFPAEGGSYSGTNAHATAEPSEPDHAGSGLGPLHSIWYSWTPSTGGSGTVSTCSDQTVFDSRVAVYTGSSLAGLSEVAKNLDSAAAGCAGKRAQTSFSTSAGQTYLIAIDTQGDLAGNGSGPSTGGVQVTVSPGPGGDQPLPDPLLVAIPAPETLGTAKMPDLRPGSLECRRKFCNLSHAKSKLRAAGITNYRLVEKNGDIDDVPKKLRSRVNHGDVVSTDPAPDTEIAIPNVKAYPTMELPKIKLRRFFLPQLTTKCGEKGLADRFVGQPLWPGVTTGRGDKKLYGAQDLLEQLRCRYFVRYKKKAGVTEPVVAGVSPGDKVRVDVLLPKTEELQVVIDEGRFHPDLAGKNLVGPNADGRMPTTGNSKGALVVRVIQITSAPAVPLPGVGVSITDSSGFPVAVGRTKADGSVALIGGFDRPDTYTVTALREADNGLTLDGTAKLKVENFGKVTTHSGRRFRFENKKWELQKPVGNASSASVSAAEARTARRDCNLSGDEESADVALFVLDALLANIDAAKTPAETEEATARFINWYLRMEEGGLLKYAGPQKYLAQTGVAIINLGDTPLKAVGALCEAVSVAQVLELARGFEIKRPLPAIQAGGQTALPNGTLMDASAFDFSGVAIKPSLPTAAELSLALDERALIVQALIAVTGGKINVDLGNAARGVISTGGGNLIGQAGGNFAAVRPGLTIEQLRGLFAVISTGGGNVISTGGGNLTAAEKSAAQKVISTGGGNLIGQAGGNLTDVQLRALLRVISTGGGNLIGQAGGNLSAAERDALSAVISTGGGNVISTGGGNLTAYDTQLDALQGVISVGGGNLSQVISTGGGNLNPVAIVQSVISTGGGNVISTGGGNLRDVIAPFVSHVISTGGGNIARQLGATELSNLATLISDKGLGLISDKGLGLIGQAGGKLNTDAGGG